MLADLKQRLSGFHALRIQCREWIGNQDMPKRYLRVGAGGPDIYAMVSGLSEQRLHHLSIGGQFSAKFILVKRHANHFP